LILRAYGSNRAPSINAVHSSKDLGSKTLEFRAMERFDPDKSWSSMEAP